MKTVTHEFKIYATTNSENARYGYNHNYLEHNASAHNRENQPYVHEREIG